MNPAPELSVIIPAYNEERRLPETLRRIPDPKGVRDLILAQRTNR